MQPQMATPKKFRIPYNYTARPYQLDFLGSMKRFRICVWHRRSGKSKTALNDQILKVVSKPGIYYYILPTYKQAKAVMWDSLVKEHIPRELVEKINDSELAVYWKNGSIQRFVGAEDPQKHRGINPIDVVFDEFSEMKEEMWTEIIQPVLRENKGTATFIFTFRGRNHAWKMFNAAKENPQWFCQLLTANDTNAIDPAELLEAERNMPRAMFMQEFLCNPIDDASAVFRKVRERLWDGIMEPNPGHQYQVGVDLAKYNDWTVITPLDRNTFKVGLQDRFNQIDWNLQESRIETAAYKWNNAAIKIDSTGVGDPICEELVRRGLNIDPQEGFKFNETSRRQLLENLAMMIEGGKLTLPNDEGLLTELEAFRYTLGESGKLKMMVPDSMTDDRVMSLALSCWGVGERIGIYPQQEFAMYGQRMT